LARPCPEGFFRVFDGRFSFPWKFPIRSIRPNQHPQHIGGKDVAPMVEQLSDEVQHCAVGREPITSKAGVVRRRAKPFAAQVSP